MDEYLWSQIISQADPITRIALSLISKTFYRLAQPLMPKFGPILDTDGLSEEEKWRVFISKPTTRCSKTITINKSFKFYQGYEDLFERLVFASQPQTVTLNWGFYSDLTYDCITLEPLNGQIWLDMLPRCIVQFNDLWLRTEEPAEIKVIYHFCSDRDWILEPRQTLFVPRQVILDRELYLCGSISSIKPDSFLSWRQIWEPRWK